MDRIVLNDIIHGSSNNSQGKRIIEKNCKLIRNRINKHTEKNMKQGYSKTLSFLSTLKMYISLEKQSKVIKMSV